MQRNMPYDACDWKWKPRAGLQVERPLMDARMLERQSPQSVTPRCGNDVRAV